MSSASASTGRVGLPASLVAGKGLGYAFLDGRSFFDPRDLADSQAVEIQKNYKTEVDCWEQQWEEYLFVFRNRLIAR